MRFHFTLLLLALKISMPNSYAQWNKTANDSIPPYNANFLVGTNPGYYNMDWTDPKKADIAKALGIKTLRPSLPHVFIEANGSNYNIRVNEFNYYKSIGMQDNVIFLNTYFKTLPSESPSAFDVTYNSKYMDSTKFPGCDRYPQVFKNLYTPIWDNGENGTPVNDNNHFALYVYKVVKTYKGHGKFWEILNEPDFCGSSSCEDAPGVVGSWWTSPPKPCDLVNFYAPVFYYIRMLKISYEVIKSIDPTSYVALGGIGYPSYLDCLLRYTDNPADGSVTAEYPLKGGAYFDVVSYHAYPQYRLRKWNNTKQAFDHFRFSDAAADTVYSFKRSFDKSLNKYGYNGVTYPKKLFIITEFNTPRKQYPGSDNLGSEESQRNSMMKAIIKAQKEGIKQFHTYQLGDTKDAAVSNDWHDLMGLYLNLVNNKPGQQVMSNTGIGLKTTATLLDGYAYDAARTTSLALPSGVEGAAFKNSQGNYRYALWARTKTDQSEVASATYTFPSALGFTGVVSYDWNYSADATKTKTLGLANVALTGSPTFFAEVKPTGFEDEEMAKSRMTVFPNPSSNGRFSIEVSNVSGEATLKILSGNGSLISTEKVFLSANTPLEQSISLDKGLYLVQLQTNAGLLVQKLVIE